MRRLIVAALCSSVCVGGCSMSFPISSLIPEPDNTGSVKTVSPLSSELNAEDWRRARGALSIALDPQGNGSSVAWDNPETGLKGTFVPVGQPFVSKDDICRAFLASVAQENTSWLQGTACRPSGGEWSLKDVRSWKKPG